MLRVVVTLKEAVTLPVPIAAVDDYLTFRIVQLAQAIALPAPRWIRI